MTQTPNTPSQSTIKHHDVIVIGAGISGIGAGIQLIKNKINDFIILEKHNDVGGTWRDNTYPGCACDVPSALYSYSFEQKPDWSRAFAGQKEIHQYVRNTAKKYGVTPHIKFGIDVTQSVWDKDKNHWIISTKQGEFTANKVISCIGYLHEPIIPNLPGLKKFKGEVFHSSQWNHDCDLSGKRVAVIGTGASAIQFIPEIQPQVDKLHVFQRTPQWILPKPDHPIPAIESNFFKLPFTLNSWRKILYSGFETFGLGFRHPSILKGVEQAAKAHINLHIKDPSLKAKLTPDYTLGCKRVLMSNNYYPAMTKQNVSVHATGVEKIQGNTIYGTDGTTVEADIIILGTGFHVSDVASSESVIGEAGKSMAEVWQGSPEAYKGTTITGFPNLFLVLGPNLAIGHNSAFIVIEAQLQYVIDALVKMKEKNLDYFDTCPKTQREYNEKVQRDLQGTVWNTGGCSSYYIDQNGKNSIGFPWGTPKMKSLLSSFNLEDYVTR